MRPFVNPVTWWEVAGARTLIGAGALGPMVLIVYDAIGVPPVLAGGCQLTVAAASAGTAATFVGGSGCAMLAVSFP